MTADRTIEYPASFPRYVPAERWARGESRPRRREIDAGPTEVPTEVVGVDREAFETSVGSRSPSRRARSRTEPERVGITDHYGRVMDLPDRTRLSRGDYLGALVVTDVAGEIADKTESDAGTRGIVGHAQKATRVRDDTGRPRLLRRDFNTVDGDHDGENTKGDDHGGQRMPYSTLPPADSYPGRDLGRPTSDDASFVVRYLEESRLADGDGYLLVSPRTPYNRVPLPDVVLSIDGAHQGELVQTLDDEFGLHYGTNVALDPGDELELVVEAPPQVARHVGYETAFLDMAAMTIELPR